MNLESDYTVNNIHDLYELCTWPWCCDHLSSNHILNPSVIQAWTVPWIMMSCLLTESLQSEIQSLFQTIPITYFTMNCALDHDVVSSNHILKSKCQPSNTYPIFHMNCVLDHDVVFTYLVIAFWNPSVSQSIPIPYSTLTVNWIMMLCSLIK